MHNDVIETLGLLQNHLRVLIGKDDCTGTRVYRDELAFMAFEISANRLHDWEFIAWWVIEWSSGANSMMRRDLRELALL